MALNLPAYNEIPLSRPPVVEVICQVRFPALLRLMRNEPVELQELIRDTFPEFEIEQGLVISPPSVGSEQANPIVQPKTYRFVSQSAKTALVLAIDFFAVTSTEYTHWADFLELIELARRSVESIYKPAYATRVGLRYINRLTKKNTQSNSIDEMLGLVRSEFVEQLRNPVWSLPERFVSRYSYVDDAARLVIGTAYQIDNDEPSFILDFDYYEEERIKFDSLRDRCNRYHQRVYQAFRWCMPQESLRRFGA